MSPLSRLALAATLALAPFAAAAQEAVAAPSEPWSGAISLYGYRTGADDSGWLQPTLEADRGRLHLEARHQYEALRSGSLWAGYRFAGGEGLEWELTPMLGVVVGDTRGVAPGYEGWLGWGRLELWSEGELLFDAEDSSSSYFYNWSELTYAPAEGLRIGLVAQRTRLREEGRSIERGPLVGLSSGRVDLTLALLEPGGEAWTLVLGLAVALGD